jgi:hypothetical protein
VPRKRDGPPAGTFGHKGRPGEPHVSHGYAREKKRKDLTEGGFANLVGKGCREKRCATILRRSARPIRCPEGQRDNKRKVGLVAIATKVSLRK